LYVDFSVLKEYSPLDETLVLTHVAVNVALPIGLPVDTSNTLPLILISSESFVLIVLLRMILYPPLLYVGIRPFSIDEHLVNVNTIVIKKRNTVLCLITYVFNP
jgi:hypothetical protein